MQMIDNVKTSRTEVQAAATAFQTATNSVDMENYNRCRITLVLEQAGAGTATATLKQGTTTTAATALAYTDYMSNELGTDVMSKVTSATATAIGGYTGTNTYQWEIIAEDLTKTSANNHVRLDVASISNNTAGYIQYDLYEPRYAKEAASMLTAEG